jgi:hypothetical protein
MKKLLIVGLFALGILSDNAIHAVAETAEVHTESQMPAFDAAISKSLAELASSYIFRLEMLAIWFVAFFNEINAELESSSFKKG